MFVNGYIDSVATHEHISSMFEVLNLTVQSSVVADTHVVHTDQAMRVQLCGVQLRKLIIEVHQLRGGRD